MKRGQHIHHVPFIASSTAVQKQANLASPEDLPWAPVHVPYPGKLPVRTNNVSSSVKDQAKDQESKQCRKQLRCG